MGVRVRVRASPRGESEEVPGEQREDVGEEHRDADAGADRACAHDVGRGREEGKSEQREDLHAGGRSRVGGRARAREEGRGRGRRGRRYLEVSGRCLGGV